MDFDERFGYLLVGCALGAVLGYLMRMLQEIRRDVNGVSLNVLDIKEGVDEIDIMVKKGRRDRNEGGFMRVPWAADILMITVLIMCLWASISTGNTNNKLERNVEILEANQAQDEIQDERLEKISQCTLKYTSKTISALNERTAFTSAQANENVKVLREQTKVFRTILLIPPKAEDEVRAVLQNYVVTLTNFNEIAKKSRNQIAQNDYPTNKELAECLGVTLPEVETGGEKKE